MGHVKGLFNVYSDPVCNQQLLVLVIGQVGACRTSGSAEGYTSRCKCSAEHAMPGPGAVCYSCHGSHAASLRRCLLAGLSTDVVLNRNPHPRLLLASLRPRRARPVKHIGRSSARLGMECMVGSPACYDIACD
eukprot:105604-Chlamydomonas_euryale.AAC.1